MGGMLKIWDQSPLPVLPDKVKTPTVFIHSFEDYSCPIQEGMQMYNAIVHHGVEARMCLFKGESYGLEPDRQARYHRVRRLRETTDWSDIISADNAPGEQKLRFTFSACSFCAGVIAGRRPGCDTDQKRDAYTGQLFVVDHEQAKQLTSGNESLFVWDDEKTLLFISSRGEKPQPEAESTTFYRIRTDGGEAVKAFTLPLKVRQIIPVKKGLYVLTAQIDLTAADYWQMSEAEREAVHQRRRAETDYQIVSEQPYYQDGAGYTNGLRSRLFLYDEAQTRIKKPPERAAVSRFRTVVSPDHNHLAISGAPFVKVRQPKEGLYRMDLNTLEIRLLAGAGTVCHIRDSIAVRDADSGSDERSETLWGR